VLLVHVHQKQQRFLEVQALAFSAMSSETQKVARAQVDRLRKHMFPGAKSEKEQWAEKARRQLAEEAKKVYLVTPHGAGAVKNLKAALHSDNADMRRWASHELKERERKKKQVSYRQRRPKRYGAGITQL